MARKDIRDRERWEKMAKESGYNAGTLAQKWGISRRQLQRSCRQLFNRAPCEWLTAQKMSLASEQLRQPRQIKAVAAALGYKQTSHFSRVFKHYFGKAPSEFRTSNGR